MLLAAFAIVSATYHQGPVTLKYMPPVGKSIHYRMAMKMNMAMGAMGNMASTTAADMFIKALSRSGDVSTVETRIQNAKVTAPPNSPMAGSAAAMEKQLNGKVVKTQMNSHYTIVGTDSGLQGISAAAMGFAFPSRPMKIGESWQSTLDFSKFKGQAMGGAGMSGKVPVKMTLKSVSGGNATIDMQLKGNLSIKMPGGASPNGQPITAAMDGKATYICSISDGTLVKLTSSTNTIVPIGGMTMKQAMTQTMTRV